MKFLKICIFLFGLSVLQADENISSEDESAVHVLTEKNFDQFIEENEFTVVFFFAPWCGHCVAMKPFYHEAGRLLRDDETIKSDKKIVLAKVDATAESGLASRFQIQGYPTLKIFRKGVAYEYEGPRREAKDIIEYLVKEASNNWKPPPSYVAVLTDANFTQWVENYDLSLVEFYSPNCGFCIQLAPNYEKAAKILSEQGKPIPLAKVDATTESELKEKYDINQFPTLFMFRRGRHYPYKGGRQVHEIVDTMLRASKSMSKEITTFKQFLSNVLKPTETYALGLFDKKETPLYEIFADFASQFADDFRLFHTFNVDEVVKELRSEVKVPSIMVYYHDLAIPKKESKFKLFTEENPTFEAVEKFFFKESLPLLGHMTPKTQKLIYDRIKPICYVIYDIDIELRPHLNTLRDKVGNLAKHFKQIQFVLVNETDNSEYLKIFNLGEETESDTNLICVNENSKTFIFKNTEDTLEEDDAKSFIKKFLSGQLKPFVRSEPVKKQNPKNAVKIVVGKTFDELVERSQKDVVIAFVGLSNQQTHTFESEFAKLAKLYTEKSKHIEFAKIDMFKNDYPDTFKPSQHQPTVYYVAASDKANPIVYNEETTVKNLKKFIETNLKKYNKNEEL